MLGKLRKAKSDVCASWKALWPGKILGTGKQGGAKDLHVRHKIMSTKYNHEFASTGTFANGGATEQVKSLGFQIPDA